MTCNRAVALFAWAIIALPVSGLELSTQEGQVVDKGSGKPLADTFVIAKWSGQAPNPVDAATICLRAEVTKSDENGRFRISRTSGNLDPFITRRHRSVEVYKPGYQGTRDSRRDELYFVLESSSKTREERFADVVHRSLPFSCDLDEKELLPFLKARAAELNALAKTPRELEQLSSNLFIVEKIELGEAEAMKRLGERKKRQREALREEAK